MSSLVRGPACSPDDEEPYEAMLNAIIGLAQKYLFLPDPGALVIALATVIASRLPGNNVWMMLVAPPSFGKTEILNSLLGLDGIHEAATITEAGLLSGTPQKDRTKDSTGGLLRKMNYGDILLLKDFTSVLNMNRDSRGQLLAALREIYDGRWTRHLGTDGAKSFSWEGRIGLIGGVTGAIDRHHEVISSMGDRFLYYRLPTADRDGVLNITFDRTESEKNSKQYLQRAVAMYVSSLTIPAEPQSIPTEDIHWLKAAAEVAARGRTAVERDGVRREIIHVHELESPARLAGSLGQLYSALSLMECSVAEVRRLIARVATSCVPRDRAHILTYLGGTPEGGTIAEMMQTEQLDMPETPIRRAVEEMECLRLVTRTGKLSQRWTLHPDFAKLWTGLHPTHVARSEM
jgi:hypothetical protein